jgi:hypothetical protein
VQPPFSGRKNDGFTSQNTIFIVTVTRYLDELKLQSVRPFCETRKATWQQQEVSFWVTSGLRHGVNEIFTLLGCYAALIDSYRRFGKVAWSLKLGLIGFPETSVTINKGYVTSQKNEHLTLAVVGIGVARILWTRRSGVRISVETEDIYLFKNA